MVSDKIAGESSLQAYISMKAMRDAEAETLKLPNGELRMKAVRDVLIKKTKTYEGVALEVNYNWRTVQNWVNKYINLVGKKAGY